MTRVGILSLHSSPLGQPGQGDSGGMDVYVRELAGSLARAGLSVDVLVRRDTAGAVEVVDVEPGLRVVMLPAGHPHLSKEELPAVLPAFEQAAAEWLETHPVDVLHANYWLSAEVGHRLKHRFADTLGKRLPLVVTFHTLERVKARAGDVSSERRAFSEQSVVGCADVLCAATEAEAADLAVLYGAPADRIEMIAPGVDHAFFSPGDQAAARAALDIGPGAVALFVGRIQPLKGVDVAVEALALSQTRDARLVVIGGPSGRDGVGELDRVAQLARRLGVADRVEWIPPQPHHVLSTWYRAADVCVVPSRSESFGLVALEAAACGRPVVATATGGLLTVVDDGTTGRLVERSASAFAAAMDQLWADPIGAAAMGEAAARHAVRFSWASAAGRLRRVYADLEEANHLVSCGRASI